MSDKTADFVHLHVHSEYSLLDGASRLKALAAAAAANNMPALALTDHGNMAGAIEFYEACKAQDVSPIIGCEYYIAPASRFDKKSEDLPESAHHLILLAKNFKGYQNLMKLTTIANREGFYYKPRIDKEVLNQHSEGVMCLSACLQGEVSYWLARGEYERAKDAAASLGEIFDKGDFYLEIQDHGIDDQVKIIPNIFEIGKELDLPVVATNDLHYVEKSDAKAHDALLCIQTQATIDETDRFKFDGDEFYFKTPEEMLHTFKEVKEAVLRTREVAEKAELEIEFGKHHLPNFPPPEGKTSEGYLRELVSQGAKDRYEEVTQEVQERVDHELGIIEGMGFVSYFLIVWDVIEAAKRKGIPVGPGRGSAAGSVVSYCLGITELDPIKHQLLFERFLNPDRVSMPDIDIDFCYERRPEMAEYVTELYGENNVAHVITFGTMQAKAAIRDVARVMSFSYQEADKIAKMVPMELGITLERAMETVPELKNLYKTDSRVRELLDTSMNLEGLVRHASTHAAGVVIADGDLTNYTPIVRGTDGQGTTGYSMGSLEKIGILKMDFLGLRTLTVVHDACKLVTEMSGKPFDIADIPEDDKKTFEMLTRAESSAVFQLESSGMQDLLRRLKPERFEDLVALVALFRPGPLGSGIVDDFINRKHGLVRVKYDHPILEPILKDSYGVCVFQEQVMQIANKLAGFTLAQADELRRAMGKKKPEVIEKAREGFIAGALNKDVDRKVANKIFDQIEYFAGYAFNRSHSAAYGLVAYQTAYLKANHPVEFMTAMLTSERDNTDKIAKYVEECRRMGIEVLPPDINKSYSRFTVEDGKIRYGLLAIKNVGGKAIESVIQMREEDGAFKSLEDFCERVDSRTVNRKVNESLVKCGAFDGFGLHRSQLLAVLDDAISLGAQRQKDATEGQLSFFDVFNTGENPTDALQVPNIDEWPDEQRLGYEKELLGFYLTGHPLQGYEEIFKLFSTLPLQELGEREDGETVLVGGIITRVKHTTTKRNNERMAIIGLEDFAGQTESLILPQVFPRVLPSITADAVVLVKGRVSVRDESPKIMADDVVVIEEMVAAKMQSIQISLRSGMSQDTLAQLKGLLQQHSGDIPVELLVQQEKGFVRVAVGKPCYVTPSVIFLKDLVALIGAESVFLKHYPLAERVKPQFNRTPARST